MEEKILIEGKPSTKVIPIFFIIIGVFFFLMFLSREQWADDFEPVLFVLLASVTFFILGVITYIAWGSSSITVTDKRVYGIALFGSRVDIPIDSVSAVGTVALTRGIIVSSSSGRIAFAYIYNNDEIHKILSDVVINRGKSNGVNTIIKSDSIADELKKFKELLDQGVITQKEFDDKKKDILGL